MADKKHSYVQTVLEPLASAAIGYGVNQLMSSFSSKDTKREASRPLPNFASPQGPVYYGPGGGGRFAPNLPPRRRQRNRRRNARRRRARARTRQSNRGARRSTMSREIVPVGYSDSICNYENMFSVSPTRQTTHGPAASIAFSGIITTLGNNGVVLRNDYQNAISMGFNVGGASGQIPSGFLSTDGNWVSGFLCYPGYWLNRLYREFYNWTEYRPRWIKFRFQNALSTSTAGTFIAAFTRDPSDWIEAGSASGATYATATHSASGLSENIPNCTANVYRDFGLIIDKFDPNIWYKTEWSKSAPVVAGNDPGTVALERQSSFGRFVCLYNGPTGNVLANAGNLWVSGVLDVAGPTSSALLIPGTQQTSGFMESSSCKEPNVFQDGKWVHPSDSMVQVSEDTKLGTKTWIKRKSLLKYGYSSLSSGSSSSEDFKSSSASSLPEETGKTKIRIPDVPWEEEGTP